MNNNKGKNMLSREISKTTFFLSITAIILIASVAIGLTKTVGTGSVLTEISAGANSANAQSLQFSTLRFTGANYATFTNLPRLTVFTYEAWVKRDADTNTYETMFGDPNANYAQAMVAMFVDGGNNECSGASDQFAYYQSAGGQVQCSGVTAEIGRWYHVAVTRDSSARRRFFVNGTLVNTVNSSRAPSDSNGIFTLGRGGSYDGEYFRGEIDEVRISNNARYTNSFTLPTAQLSTDANTIALWQFDEQDGQVLYDSSTNSRNGYLGLNTNVEAADALRGTDSPFNQTNPSASPSSTPSASPTATPTQSSSPTPTASPSPTPTQSPTPSVTAQPSPVTGNFGTALRFFGTGTNSIDRVEIPINSSVNVGATDMTIEWWMKANSADNTPRTSCSIANDAWINGNILIDRDIWGGGDYGDFGISLFNGRIAFGVSQGDAGNTLCGTRNVADGQWHHVAVTRRVSDGYLFLYVDGQPDGSIDGANGNVSYRVGRNTSYPKDPLLVFGAEKHDAGTEYPSYNGLLDEVRISNTIRYTGSFSRPTAPFNTDSNTRALYRFNEGSGTVATDSSGNNATGQLRIGGASNGPQYVPSM